MENASGIVFDMDGVLIDSEPIYMETINLVLSCHGAGPLSADDYGAFIGRHVAFTWPALRERYGLPASVEALRAEYEGRLEAALPGRLRLRPDAERMLAAVEERGIPRALATSSRRKWLELKLRTLGLESFFAAAVSAEDVGRFKPEPDVYLEAAERAGMDPSSAVAIEDSPSGITSAKRAGMRVFALRTESAVGLDLSEADDIIESLTEIDLGALFGAGDRGHAPSGV